ncbi:glycine cleavage system protein GcvH [Angustibacter sp. Root456]|uniref:glycine cleavage system protein GcvH n=1 Tax=Angustibacter sp. Root456 TaxID=1736539 RepID=UPI0006F2C994|nr:glycine cleavage system protein GcvH [Angustibacter sp. Root456]KQX61816.1 glycine cleavage system protein H [Angustibacter sp. Root456]
MPIPTDRQYTAEHEWVLVDGDVATVGITEFAANALGDVVYVSLPEPGSTLTAGGVCGEVESTKSVSDLFAPFSGEVTETNADVEADPSLVNASPFERGWLFRARIEAADGLLDPAAYAALTDNA